MRQLDRAAKGQRRCEHEKAAPFAQDSHGALQQPERVIPQPQQQAKQNAQKTVQQKLDKVVKKP